MPHVSAQRFVSAVFMSHQSAYTVTAQLMANIRTHIHFNPRFQGRKTANIFRLIHKNI